MKILLILIFLITSSCTFRSYEVKFNYYVGNNGTNKIEWKDHQQECKEEVVNNKEEKIKQIQIPKGSGNLVIYIEAKVPKNIETSAEAQLTPFKNSLIGR